MVLRWLVRPNTYHDSVKLMRLSDALAGEPGIERAAAVMATPLNVELLAADELLPPDVEVAADDLIVAVQGMDAASADAALARMDALLAPRVLDGGFAPVEPKTLEQAVDGTGANLAVIAVPGPSAALEALAALRAGLHVFLFSNNVPLHDEIRLKELARRRDLLMMGPDCGTAIIDGVGLGFANRVDRGPVGIVGASGTGIQQVCCLLDEAGVGIAQAIGTGGRDLSADVGGRMTHHALHLLAADDSVGVLVVISKPPGAAAVEHLHALLAGQTKPVIACLLGNTPEDAGSVHYAGTLTDLARLVCQTLDVAVPASWVTDPPPRRHAGFHSRVYGLFSGGTLAAEAAQVLDRMHVPHTLVDLGNDRFTSGRAHPMIDPRLRVSALGDIARHGDAGAILLDVVLGDLAHVDPAGALVPAIEKLRAKTDMPVIAALIGTHHDPQDLDGQRGLLAGAGVEVYASNAQAARAAGVLVGGVP